MNISRSSCTECSRMKQDAMKLRMDVSSLQASNRALIDKQKIIEQQIKEHKLQLRQQALTPPTPALSGDASLAEELDRVKHEYFNVRQELESLREGARENEELRTEAERRAVDAENWIQIKDSIIEKQRNLLKQSEVNRSELQAELSSSKTNSVQAQQELSRRVEELTTARSETQRLEEELSRRNEELGRLSGRAKKGGAAAEKQAKKGADNEMEEERQGDSDVEADRLLRQQLEKTRAELAKSEASRRTAANDLAASRRRMALKEASVKSLQAALETERALAAQKENAHSLLDSENAYLRSENSSLKEEAERSAATIAGLETRVGELEVELNLKTESAAQSAAEMEALKEAVRETQEKEYEKRVRCSSEGGVVEVSGLAGPDVGALAGGEDSCSGPPQPGEEACLAAVSEKITRQETQIADLNTLLSYRESCILKMHEEMGKLRSAIDVANTEKDTLNASITILKKELAQAREEAKGKREAVAEMDEKLEEARTKRSREYGRRKRAEKEADELYRENEELRHRVAKLEASLKQAGDASQKSSRDPLVGELQATVKELRTDNEAKRSELFDVKAKLEEKLSALEELQTKVKGKERSVTELRNQIYALQTSAEAHQEDLVLAREEVSRLSQEQKRTKQDLASILASNRHLSESCADLRTKLKDKERQVGELVEKNQSLTRAQEGSSGVNADEMTGSTSALCAPGSTGAGEALADGQIGRADRWSFQRTVEAMEAKLRELIQDKHNLAQECAEVRSKSLSLELQLATARSECSKQTAGAESASAETRRVQAEVKRLKADSERQMAELRRVLADKEGQLSRKRRCEGELMDLIEQEKRRRVENGTAAAEGSTLLCAQCELLAREMAGVESYIGRKDEEFAQLTGQLLETQAQEVLVRNDLARSKAELQLRPGDTAQCGQAGGGLVGGEGKVRLSTEPPGSGGRADVGPASGQSRL